MARQGKSLTIAGVLVAAFLGGAVSHLLFDGAAARAATQPTVPAAAQEGQIMRAYGFVVVDEHGKELARLGVSEKGQVGLTVFDAKDKTRLRIGALEEPTGYGMRAYDAEGHNRATFAHWTDGTGGLRVFDAEGVKRIGLGSAAYGSGLSMQNAAGTNIVGIGVGPGAGGGDLTLKHPDGHEVWRASKAAEGAYAKPTQP